MTDPLDRLLRPLDVDPLAPPTGRFEEITRRARSRRRYRAAGAGLFTVAVLAGAATGSVLLTRPDPAPDGPPNPPAASATASPEATASPAASASGAAAPTLGTGPVPRGFRPWSVSYVSSSVGFLLGDAPCRRPPCTSLVVTGDGGRTWRGLPAPRAPLPANRLVVGPAPGQVSEVRFANPSDGWVFGDALYATHDGGRHWQRQTFSLPAGELAVLDVETDGRTAYALAATCGSAGSRCKPHPLYQTPVSADDWRPVPGVASGSHPYGGDLALSGQHGLVILLDPPTSRAWAYRSSSWTPAAIPPCATGPPPSAVAASASTARLVAFCGEGAAGSLYLSPWVSDDSGATWRKVADGSARVPGGVLSVAAASSTLLLVAAGNPDLGGTVLRSTDGGRTFAEAGLPRLATGWWYVGARTATSLVALPGSPDGSVWSSRDGGRTWQSYRFH